MALIHLKNISLAFGISPILKHAHFTLDAGERVCLIGRNGEGKSTLLKLIAGTQAPDDGEILIKDGLKIAMLAQDVPTEDGNLLEVVMQGDAKLAQLLMRYHALADTCAQGDMDACHQMNTLQEQIDALHGWELERHARALLENMGLDADARLAELSGGRKRRALLARALVMRPDVLLLDEPTNHLDVESIDWLEKYLLGQNIALLFITHDRKFVDNLATRIVELDRGKLSGYDVRQGVGGYARYQELKALELQAEAKSFEEFDKKLAQEEIWIRQGIKARRTRNEGRVRALKALREERKQRRDAIGNVSLTQNIGEKSGKVVCEVNHLTLGFGDRILVKDFSTLLMRGDKVGIIGSNGAGKTTLIRTILGLDTDAKISGDIQLGTNLNIAFFDQLKDQLDPQKSVAENVSEGSDHVEIGKRKKHILGYLQDFLFSPNRARTPVKALSGGEKARVLLAKNLLRPANVLVLDEPTNDLDMATLELLEEYVASFDGTILIISHDRAFMDNVVTQTWVFDSDDDQQGVITEYVGGYGDYLQQKARSGSSTDKAHKTKADKPSDKTQSEKAKSAPKKDANLEKSSSSNHQKRKLSYKEQREIESLPDEIQALEDEQTKLGALIADGSLFVSDLALATQYSERLNQIDELLIQKLERWDELESLIS